MNQNRFSAALSELNDRYIEEALDYRPPVQRRGWIKWGAAAACFTLVFAALFVLSPDRSGQPGVTPPDLLPAVTNEPPAPDETSAPATPTQAPEAVRVSMSGIFVNENTESAPDGARRYFDSDRYDEVIWDRAAVAEYYGRDLVPSWVPDGLTDFNPEASARAWILKDDGTVAEDTLSLSYYQTFGTWEDGSPRTIDERTVRHGFTLSASRVGLFNCGIVYIGPEDEVKSSDIAGIPVTIGYRAMSHGPYDPNTHEPAGYYDLYVAEFDLDSVQVQLVADELELEEVVKVVASVICPGQEIVVEP